MSSQAMTVSGQMAGSSMSYMTCSCVATIEMPSCKSHPGGIVMMMAAISLRHVVGVQHKCSLSLQLYVYDVEQEEHVQALELQ